MRLIDACVMSRYLRICFRGLLYPHSSPVLGIVALTDVCINIHAVWQFDATQSSENEDVFYFKTHLEFLAKISDLVEFLPSSLMIACYSVVTVKISQFMVIR